MSVCSRDRDVEVADPRRMTGRVVAILLSRGGLGSTYGPDQVSSRGNGSFATRPTVPGRKGQLPAHIARLEASGFVRRREVPQPNEWCRKGQVFNQEPPQRLVLSEQGSVIQRDRQRWTGRCLPAGRTSGRCHSRRTATATLGAPRGASPSPSPTCTTSRSRGEVSRTGARAGPAGHRATVGAPRCPTGPAPADSCPTSVGKPIEVPLAANRSRRSQHRPIDRTTVPTSHPELVFVRRSPAGTGLPRNTTGGPLKVAGPAPTVIVPGGPAPVNRVRAAVLKSAGLRCSSAFVLAGDPNDGKGDRRGLPPRRRVKRGTTIESDRRRCPTA